MSIRFGRFDEVLDVTKRPERELPGAAWEFAQGYAHLRKGHADFARLYAARVQKTAATSTVEFRNHPAKRFAGILAGILEGEIARDAKEVPAAIDADLAASWSRSDTWIRASCF